MATAPQRVPSFRNTKEKIEVREVCVGHGAPHSGRRDTTCRRSTKSPARGNQRQGGVITADAIVVYPRHAAQVGVFWKVNLHHKAVMKAFFFSYTSCLISCFHLIIK